MRRNVLSLVLVIAAVCAVSAVAAEAPATTGKVNLNTASADQLQLLPRVGPALASRIIAFRDANGPFKTPDELVAVKGIGDKSLAVLKPYLAIEGETTLADKVKVPRRSSTADSAS